MNVDISASGSTAGEAGGKSRQLVLQNYRTQIKMHQINEVYDIV